LSRSFNRSIAVLISCSVLISFGQLSRTEAFDTNALQKTATRRVAVI
jgi:hypothetical protein